MLTLWEAWMDAFEELYQALPARKRVVCPTNGDGEVRLAFTGSSSGSGTALVWCDTCMTGIFLHRTRVPAGVTPLAPEKRRRVPNFRIIAPDAGSDDEDVESAVL
ncbi:hypothetical protein [Micromonospora sp. CA-111912]|uniref:hypothetical protein n=1 Tax=Micromonospora sp. CA-111912 TaxID=3239955 RepID=UPI003D90EA2C